jgi:hypothetical protein
MNCGPGGRRRRWPGCIWRFAGGRLAGALLLCAVLVAVAGVVLLVVGRSVPDAGIVEAGQIALLLALLSGLGFCVQGGVRAVRRRARSRRVDPDLQPAKPPIEEIAADLRRMLWQHDLFARSNDIPKPAGRLRALEVRMTRRAVQAAHALEVAHPDPPPFGGFDTAQLRRVLHDLKAEGLVLPPEVGLMAPDSRF